MEIHEFNYTRNEGNNSNILNIATKLGKSVYEHMQSDVAQEMMLL